MKKILCVFMAIVIMFGCSACSSKITSGEVYKKEYRESFTTVNTMPVCVYNGTSTTIILVPYIISYPERYVIFIKEFIDGEWVTEDFYVSKELFDQINIGDMFVYDESRGDLLDEPYTKEKQN